MTAFYAKLVNYNWDGFPLEIRFALFIIAFSLITFVVLGGYLVFKRFRFLLSRARDEHWNPIISDLLTEFMISYEGPLSNKKIGDILPQIAHLPIHSKVFSTRLYRQLIKFHASFTGSAAEHLRELFLKLRFNRILKQKLQSFQNSVKIQALQEIAQLRLDEFARMARLLTNHPSPAVRLEAQAAYMVINEQHSFDFLSQVNEPILDWHQLHLIEIADQLNPTQLPDFSKWLGSANPSVVKLCLKLVAHFQQFQAQESLIALLGHPDREIRKLTVTILGEFEAAEAEDELLKIYLQEDQTIKQEIIRALGRINAMKHLDFLVDGIASNQFELAFQAVSALKNQGDNGLRALNTYYPKASLMSKAIIDQFITPIKT